MTNAHSTDLYTIGKGILQFDRNDDAGLPTGLRDLGNAPNFALVPSVETLDHFSSREGVKKKDKTINLSVGMTVKFTLDEYDINNLAMALLGEVSGGNLINLLASGQIEGRLVFIGHPAAGPAYRVTLWNVQLKPTSEVPFISDEWGKIDFEGTVQYDITAHPTQEYGTIEEIIAS